MTMPGELARVTGLSRPGGRARQPRAGGRRLRDDEGPGVYQLARERPSVAS